MFELHTITQNAPLISLLHYILHFKTQRLSGFFTHETQMQVVLGAFACCSVSTCESERVYHTCEIHFHEVHTHRKIFLKSQLPLLLSQLSQLEGLLLSPTALRAAACVQIQMLKISGFKSIIQMKVHGILI